MPRSHRQRSCIHQSDESRKHQHAPYPLRVGVSCFEYQDGWGHIDLLKRRKRRTRTRRKIKENNIANSTGSIKLDGSRAEYCRKWILIEFSYCWDLGYFLSTQSFTMESFGSCKCRRQSQFATRFRCHPPNNSTSKKIQNRCISKTLDMLISFHPTVMKLFRLA